MIKSIPEASNENLNNLMELIFTQMRSVLKIALKLMLLIFIPF